MTTEHRDAYFRRGCALRVNGRADLAAREFERAVEADPQHARSFAMLAYCRNDLGDSRALDASFTAVSLDPTDSFNHRARGWALIGAQRAPDALAPAREALNLSPREPENFVLLAEVLLRTADHAGALRATDGALALRPEHATAHRQRAVALRHLGRLDEAKTAAEKALALDPDAFWSHLVVARVAAARRDADAAARSYREALRLDPSSAEARQGLVLAMKLRNRAYRWATVFHEWFFRLPRLARIGIVLAAIYLTKGFGLIVAIIVVVAGHAVDPIANLVLRFDRYGRHLLSAKQMVASDFVATILLSVAGGLAGGTWGGTPSTLFLGAFIGALVPCAASVRNCRPGRPTWLMAGYVGLLVGAASFAVFLERQAPASPKPDEAGIEFAAVVVGFMAVLGLVAGPMTARHRFGYPWSHRFDAPSR